MDFNKEIVLENERVRLEPLRKDHFKDLLPFSKNEPDLWKYSLISGAGPANLKNYINLAIEARSKGDSYPFVVFDKQRHSFAGSTRFYDYQNHHLTIQLGYTWYGKVFQRTGLNRNCKLLMLSYAFEVLELSRVEFRADALNTRSIKAMKQIGCIEEGILRQNCKSPEGRRDSIVLSILRDEWLRDVKKNLISKIR